MTLEFTPEQYRSLIKLAYVGSWMINGIKTEDERDAATEDIMQALYAHAKEAQCGDYASYDERDKKFVATKKLDQDPEVEKYREEYDNEIFWDELIEKLSLRDVLAMQEGKHWYGGDSEEVAHIRSGIIKKYIEEFEKNGVHNLIIKGDEAPDV